MTAVVTFLIGTVLIVLAIIGMAIGVLFGRPPLKGSCGGLAGNGCELCSGHCRRRTRRARASGES